MVVGNDRFCRCESLYGILVRRIGGAGRCAISVRGPAPATAAHRGMDTIEKMAQWDPQELRTMIVQFVEQTGFDGIATLPTEARFSVQQAKKLPRIVEY